MSVKSIKRNDKKSKNNNFNKIKPFIFSTLISLLVWGIGVVITSLIVYKSESEISFVYFIQYIFAFFGAFFGAVKCKKKVGGRGFLVGVISSIPFAVILLLICSVLMRFEVGVNLLLLIPIVLVGGFSGGITAVNTRI